MPIYFKIAMQKTMEITSLLKYSKSNSAFDKCILCKRNQGSNQYQNTDFSDDFTTSTHFLIKAEEKKFVRWLSCVRFQFMKLNLYETYD